MEENVIACVIKKPHEEGYVAELLFENSNAPATFFVSGDRDDVICALVKVYANIKIVGPYDFAKMVLKRTEQYCGVSNDI